MSLVLVWLMKLRWCCGEGFEEGKYWLWLICILVFQEKLCFDEWDAIVVDVVDVAIEDFNWEVG